MGTLLGCESHRRVTYNLCACVCWVVLGVEVEGQFYWFLLGGSLVLIPPLPDFEHDIEHLWASVSSFTS
jgi:hypothetical protein